MEYLLELGAELHGVLTGNGKQSSMRYAIEMEHFPTSTKTWCTSAGEKDLGQAALSLEDSYISTLQLH